jgi:hypothetical protein
MQNFRNLISFYGIKPKKGSLKIYYEEFIAGAQEKRVPVNAVSLKPARRKGYVSSEKAAVMLDKVGFDNVTSLEALSLPSPDASRLIDYSIAISYSEKFLYLNVSAPAHILPLDDQVLLNFARSAAKLFTPGYGYGCSLGADISPILYSIALELYNVNAPILKNGSPEHIKALTLARWGDVGMHEKIWEHGVIRDVHPWNFLTSPQLNASVNGETLAAWIEAANGSRGTLTPITPKMTFWQIDMEHIPATRDALEKCGIVFSYEKHLEFTAKPK